MAKKKGNKSLKRKKESKAEPFFLETFNTDAVFRSVDRKDYIILHYIKQCLENTNESEKVYLSDLADAMQIGIPEVSKAVERLNDNGFVEWATDDNRGKTYVILTSKAIELMSDELSRMKKIYAMIRREIGDEEFEHTMFMLRKIARIIQDAGKAD